MTVGFRSIIAVKKYLCVSYLAKPSRMVDCNVV
nr:MAG TPA: hypothetical protein [Caudoviricetes sp.]